MVYPNQNNFGWDCNSVEKYMLRPCCPPAALSALTGSHNSTFAVSADIYVVQSRGPVEIPRKSIRGRTSEASSGAELVVNKNLNGSRPSEHPPVRGENVKTVVGYVVRAPMY